MVTTSFAGSFSSLGLLLHDIMLLGDGDARHSIPVHELPCSDSFGKATIRLVVSCVSCTAPDHMLDFLLERGKVLCWIDFIEGRRGSIVREFALVIVSGKFIVNLGLLLRISPRWERLIIQ